MIKVKYKKTDNYQYIEMKGHAKYDSYGKDIVCSAASSIITTSINSILALNTKGLKFKDKSGEVIINEISDDNNTQTLLNVMLNLLKDLSDEYPNNIQISKED